MRLALYRPERLQAMVILDSTAEGTTLRERIKYGLFSQVALRVGLPPTLIRKKIAPLMFSPRTFMRAPELVDQFVRSVSGFSRRGVANAVNAVSIDRPAIFESLREVRVPTLVGYGADDVPTPAHHSRRIASYIAGSTLVTFKGAGHLSALEEPQQVNDYVLPFVEENLGG
jgi:pimeloyl-ACP methyl ester carboxylesterase